MGNISSWSLGTTEIGKSCGYNSLAYGKNFKVYIAKILPLISFGSPSSTSVPLSKNCFCNASACKPSVASSVTSRNYIDIPMGDDSNIYASSSGRELKIGIVNGNVDKMYIINKLY
jgi:hypothetical protein